MSQHVGQGKGSLARSVAQAVGIVAAVLMVIVAIRFAPRSASAGDDQPVGMINPLDQRNTMIAELRQLNQRLERIEKRLGADVPVE